MMKRFQNVISFRTKYIKEGGKSTIDFLAHTFSVNFFLSVIEFEKV